MALLTSGAHDNSFTSSSVLPAHNTEFSMAPLQIASHPTPTGTYRPPARIPKRRMMKRPLILLAMASTYGSMYQSFTWINHESVFSPLSSPALHPSMSNKEHSSLQQKLACIEKQQQQLRNTHSQLRGATSSPVLNNDAGYTSPHITYQDNNKIKKKPSQLKLSSAARTTTTSITSTIVTTITTNSPAYCFIIIIIIIIIINLLYLQSDHRQHIQKRC